MVTWEWTVVSGAGTVVGTVTFGFGAEVVAGAVPVSDFVTLPGATVVGDSLDGTDGTVVVAFATMAPFSSTKNADSATCSGPWAWSWMRTVARPAVVSMRALTIDAAPRRTFTSPGTVPAQAENAARAPRTAHRVSAACGDSAVSSPPMNEIPFVRVTIQPTTTAPLISAPRKARRLLLRSMARIPHPTCRTVQARKIRTRVG